MPLQRGASHNFEVDNKCPRAVVVGGPAPGSYERGEFYNGGNWISGSISERVAVYDSGTEDIVARFQAPPQVRSMLRYSLRDGVCMGGRQLLLVSARVLS